MWLTTYGDPRMQCKRCNIRSMSNASGQYILTVLSVPDVELEIFWQIPRAAMVEGNER
jgi:hypothetical protein